MMAGAAAGLFLLYFYRIRHKGNFKIQGLVPDRRLLKKECVLYGILFLFLMYIMFYVFYIREGILYSGFTVYGDSVSYTHLDVYKRQT